MPCNQRTQQRVFSDLADGLLVALGHVRAWVEFGPVDLNFAVSYYSSGTLLVVF